jgi:hypothetical protein
MFKDHAALSLRRMRGVTIAMQVRIPQPITSASTSLFKKKPLVFDTNVDYCEHVMHSRNGKSCQIQISKIQIQKIHSNFLGLDL